MSKPSPVVAAPAINEPAADDDSPTQPSGEPGCGERANSGMDNNNHQQDHVRLPQNGSIRGDAHLNNHDYLSTHEKSYLSVRTGALSYASLVTVETHRPVFYPFNDDSYYYLQQREQELLKQEEEKLKPKEAKLVDGELKYGDEDDESDENEKVRDPRLVEGNILPEDLGEFPDELYGVPLEEIDPYIKEKTFVVVVKRFTKKFIHRFSATKAFFLLAPHSRLRATAVRIATHQIFDYFVILTILANCVYLAITDPGTQIPEYVFLAIYTFEMFIKLTARGFIIGKYTYLRDPWNWLDFFVVMTSYLTLILDAAQVSGDTNVSSLRTFRVFRALKTVSIIAGLRTIVNALLKSLKMLAEVMGLTFFCISVFALFGLQVYMGVLRQKCVVQPHLLGYNVSNPEEYTAFYKYAQNESNGVWYYSVELEGPLICGNGSGAQMCPHGYVCYPGIGENPNFGYTNFDNFGMAVLSSFQLVTLDFWEDTYDKINASLGPWNIFFFIIVVFFGSFYLLNLMLAVVALSYEEEAATTGKDVDDERRLHSKKNASEFYFDPTRLRIIRLKRKRRRLIRPLSAAVVPGDDANDHDDHTAVAGHDSHNHVTAPSSSPSEMLQNMPSNQVLPPTEEEGDGQTNIVSTRDDERVISAAGLKRNKFRATKGGESQDTGIHSMGTAATIVRTGTIADSGYGQDTRPSTGGSNRRDGINGEVNDVFSGGGDNLDTAVSNDQSDGGGCCSSWSNTRLLLLFIVNDPFFEFFITLCILLNTVALGMEHDGMSEDLTVSLEVANYVFTAIFTVEAILKLLAMGRSYFSNSWNIFDLIIVIASVTDIAITVISQNNKNIGISVIRTFRLLRVFKLAQSWRTMRVLLGIIFSTVGALGNLTFVLGIIIYMFAVMGMQLFRKSYTKEVYPGGEVPRWNFSNAFHSFMMIFRCLCGEWIEPMWDCMRVEGNLCMAVYIPSLILGHFMVLNLFLALLLNAFATDSLKGTNSSKDQQTNKTGSFSDEQLHDEPPSIVKLRFARLWSFICCCCREQVPKILSPGSQTPVEEFEMDRADSTEHPPGDNQPSAPSRTEDTPAAIENNTDNSEDSSGANKATNDNKGQNSRLQQNGGVSITVTNVDAVDENRNNQNTAATANKTEAEKNTEKPPKTVVESQPKSLSFSGPDSSNSTDKEPDVNTTSAAANSGAKITPPDSTAAAANVDNPNYDGGQVDDDKSSATTDIRPCCPLICYTRMSCCCPPADSHWAENWSKFRYKLNKVVEHKVFETFILLLIFASSITLCFEDVYLYQKPELKLILAYCNYIFAALFLIELLIKCCAFGLVEYFTNFWTLLDFFIVMVSLI